MSDTQNIGQIELRFILVRRHNPKNKSGIECQWIEENTKLPCSGLFTTIQEGLYYGRHVPMLSEEEWLEREIPTT